MITQAASAREALSAPGRGGDLCLPWARLGMGAKRVRSQPRGDVFLAFSQGTRDLEAM